MAASSTPGECERCGVVHDPARCNAHAKSTARQCGRRPTAGATVCAVHGARAPQVRAAAARTVALDKAVRALKLGNRLGAVDPAEAMLDQVREAAANVELYRHLVGTLNAPTVDPDGGVLEGGDGEPPYMDDIDRSDLGGSIAGRVDPANWKAAPHVWVVMYNDERERLVRFSKMCRDAGVEEHRVATAERMATQLVDVQTAILAAVLADIRSAIAQALVTEAWLVEFERSQVPRLIRSVVETKLLTTGATP